MKKNRQINLFSDIKFFAGPAEELLEKITSHIDNPLEKDLWTICTPNPEQMVLAASDQKFLKALQEATFAIADGWGVVWALNRLQSPDHKFQRIAGRELLHDLLTRARERSWTVFLLGGKSGAAASLGFAYDDGPKENTASILKKIREVKPQLVFVAYGAPAQELWIHEHRSELAALGVKVALVVGGAFEYEAGFVPRVSPLVESLHLEWLQRLIVEPWRWKRQLKGLQFFWNIWMHR